jgi:adenylate cyclase
MNHKPHSETRRLAAVVFADIEGYTSLFQRNEDAAMRQVEDHREDLFSISKKYNGEIIQFYGDGSVTVYDSVIDAVRSAMELQQESAVHRIPVRIGIHMGDLVYKDDDIFGDVVNVTSRIQSAGIPGSILVSKKIVDELINHPDIHTIKLGLYNLKNVKTPVELYALTNTGLAIPPSPPRQSMIRLKPYQYALMAIGILLALGYLTYIGIQNNQSKKLKEERIFISPFIDRTQNPKFASLSDEISSYITKALSGVSPANVVSNESAMLYLNTDLASISTNPTLARRTGAAYVLLGNYSLAGRKKDSLFLWGSILDLRSKENFPLTIPDVYCDSSNRWACIKEFTNNITGYWRSWDDHVFSPPNDKAYTAFLKAQKLWADPKMGDKAKSYLLESIGHDSTFLDAYFLLLDLYSNDDLYESESGLITLIKERFPSMDARQERYFRYFEEDLKGQNVEAFQYLMKALADDPGDLFLNTTALVLAIEFLNDPLSALRLNREIDIDTLDLNTCVYCRTRANMVMQAYADVLDYKQATKLAERLKPYAEKKGQVTRLISYYLKIKDTTAVIELIQNSPKRDTSFDIRQYYYFMAGRYALIYGDQRLSKYYCDKAIQLYGPVVNRTAARTHFLRGNLDRAEKMYNSLLLQKPNDKWLNAELGMIYAKRGNGRKANEIINTLDVLKKAYDLGETPYFQGRIKALLHENDAAIRYLTQALDEGIKFRVATTFQHDPDLIGLNNEPEYLKLLARNRQP